MTIIRTATLGAAFVLSASTAFAHAHLKTAAPPENAALTAVPTEISLTFTEALELAFSKAVVLGPDGKDVDTGRRQLKDHGMTLSVPLVSPAGGTLPTGTYKVDWQVLSTDGHKSAGSYSFTIAPK